MKIENENYLLDYNEDQHHIDLSGSLRLNGLDEYAPIQDALILCLESAQAMSLDLSRLEFLNSSGIAMLSKFIIAARTITTDKTGFQLTISGSKAIPWQGKSLINLQRLFPALTIEMI